MFVNVIYFSLTVNLWSVLQLYTFTSEFSFVVVNKQTLNALHLHTSQVV